MSGRAAKVLVVKIGSSTLTDTASRVDYEYLAGIADQIARVRDAGWRLPRARNRFSSILRAWRESTSCAGGSFPSRSRRS